MASIKRTPVNASVEDAISTGYDELEALKDELDEVVSNMEDSPALSATARFETLSESRDTLSNVVDSRPDWPDFLNEADLRCDYTEDRSKNLSRRARRDNAANALDAAASALQAWVDAQDEDEADEDMQEHIEEVKTLVDTLEEHREEAEEAEFPGMRG